MTLDLQVLWADLGDSHRCTHGLGFTHALPQRCDRYRDTH